MKLSRKVMQPRMFFLVRRCTYCSVPSDGVILSGRKVVPQI